MTRRAGPLTSGVLAALGAALSFGVTVPVLERAGQHVGPFTTAALLYAGACASALALRFFGRRSGTPLVRSDSWRVAVIGLVGAAAAPALLAWGVQRVGATTGGLLLNLEAVFTVLLARAVYREPIGARVAVALVLMACGGAALVLGSTQSLDWTGLGIGAVAGATLAWAIDNTVSRGLAERDPVEVVGMKGAVGTCATLALALAARESLPSWPRVAVLFVCGATGYGLSLRLYLLAQRRIGAGRTGSVFAIAPFVGAAAGWLFGGRDAGWLTVVAALLFAVGVYLHLSERHRHQHVHKPVDHVHAHRHDDGHHDHVHDPPVVGEHTHAHRHDRLAHDHEHAPDVHHDHDH